MARIRNGILGGFRGKVGNVIGQCYDGVETIRAYPSSVKNPQTSAQEAHRFTFRQLVGLLSSTSALLRYSIGGNKAVDNAFNTAMRINWREAVSDNVICAENLSFGSWYGQPFDDVLIEWLAELTDDANYCGFEVTWTSYANGVNKFENDELLAVVVCERPDFGLFVTYAGNSEAKRGENGIKTTVEIPALSLDASKEGDIFYLYLGVYSSEVVKVHDRTYTIPASNIPAFRPSNLPPPPRNPASKPASLGEQWDAFRNRIIYNGRHSI